ncbi:unnamed protein product [Toxocara canis]|uniref:BMERB domain-containing protein n=1 Tax=Toxocara canis TaxID=6265 RepID=A0A183U7Z7_TOXCA|nr:unnamed protein product [Toxocara canis]
MAEDIKEIKRVTRSKRAEQIAKQKEQERVRTAQDIQRALQETDIRKAEVVAVGSDLERRLKDGIDSNLSAEF